jgi:hypothetical protein
VGYDERWLGSVMENVGDRRLSEERREQETKQGRTPKKNKINVGGGGGGCWVSSVERGSGGELVGFLLKTRRVAQISS